jgi:hypothetical protein
MEGKLWNRRQVMESCARAAAGSMLAWFPWGNAAAAQMPPAEPLGIRSPTGHTSPMAQIPHSSGLNLR